MDFELRHPDDRRRVARYGHDIERGGPWVELEDGGVLVIYDAIHDRSYNGLAGLLAILAEWEFLGCDDLRAAEDWIDGREVERQTASVRRVLRIVLDLRVVSG